MADELYVPQVDYTSRDFLSISNDMKALIPNFAPQWTSRDSTDFGIVLLELFAYMGDLLNYYVDRAANEAFIETATQRETVVRLAKMLNYTPNDVSPASGSVTLSNSGSSTITVPTGSQFSATASDGSTTITYELLGTGVTVPAASGGTAGTATAVVTQGITVTETVGVSDGTSFQSFKLANPGVITSGTMTVYVNNLVYQKVAHIIDYGPADPVFTAVTDGTGYTYIGFGDGSSGRIPPKNQTIAVQYRYTNAAGSLGNVSAGTLTGVVGDPSGSVSLASISVSNPAALSGGTDAESTDSIRINAPLALRTLNRAVTLSDYANLAIQVPGVAKARAASATFTNVTIYIAAAGGGPSSSSLRKSVFNFMASKIPPNTSLSIADFSPAYPYLSLDVNVQPGYDPALVKSNVLGALYSLFDFNNVTFNDTITVADVNSACKAVDGVSFIDINDFEKLSVIHSMKATTSATATSSTSATTSVTVGSTAGLWAGAAITSITSSTGTSLYSYDDGPTTVATIIGITDATHFVLSTTDSAITISSGSTVVVQGNAGTPSVSGVVPNFICNLDEVPILEPTYINITTTGGIV